LVLVSVTTHTSTVSRVAAPPSTALVTGIAAAAVEPDRHLLSAGFALPMHVQEVEQPSPPAGEMPLAVHACMNECWLDRVRA
jgi:hypothetical protein